MEPRHNSYMDLKGRELSLGGLDAKSQLIAELRQRAKSRPDWDDFENHWTSAVAAFYTPADFHGGVAKRSSTNRPGPEQPDRRRRRSGPASRLPRRTGDDHPDVVPDAAGVLQGHRPVQGHAQPCSGARKHLAITRSPRRSTGSVTKSESPPARKGPCRRVSVPEGATRNEAYRPSFHPVSDCGGGCASGKVEEVRFPQPVVQVAPWRTQPQPSRTIPRPRTIARRSRRPTPSGCAIIRGWKAWWGTSRRGPFISS